MSDARKPRTYRTPTRPIDLPRGEHGTPYGYAQGCRCEECKAANRVDLAARRAAKRAEGLPVGDERHGTPGGYSYWGCRCAACVEGAKAVQRARRSGGLPAGDERHGVTGYSTYGCRCEVCVAAMSEHQKAEKAEGRRVELVDPDDPRHGTLTGYDWHGCRCDRCVAAKRADQAQRKPLGPPRKRGAKPRHAERDAAIVAAVAGGESPVAVAERYGLSRQRVHQITQRSGGAPTSAPTL